MKNSIKSVFFLNKNLILGHEIKLRHLEKSNSTNISFHEIFSLDKVFSFYFSYDHTRNHKQQTGAHMKTNTYIRTDRSPIITFDGHLTSEMTMELEQGAARNERNTQCMKS